MAELIKQHARTAIACFWLVLVAVGIVGGPIAGAWTLIVGILVVAGCTMIEVIVVAIIDLPGPTLVWRRTR